MEPTSLLLVADSFAKVIDALLDGQVLVSSLPPDCQILGAPARKDDHGNKEQRVEWCGWGGGNDRSGNRWRRLR